MTDGEGGMPESNTEIKSEDVPIWSAIHAAWHEAGLRGAAHACPATPPASAPAITPAPVATLTVAPFRTLAVHRIPVPGGWLYVTTEPGGIATAFVPGAESGAAAATHAPSLDGCNRAVAASGRPYPRYCRRCGLGPCPFETTTVPGVGRE